MTKKNRIAVVELIESLNTDEWYEFNNILQFPTHKQYGQYVGMARHKRFVESLAIRIKFLEVLKVGNDAPRGGQIGNYVEFKNTKANREALEFAKKYIEIRK